MSLSRILNRTKRLLFRDSVQAQQERTAEAYTQVFASFIIHDGETSHRELEIAYDFIRDIFPDIDHGILGQQLESAVANPLPIDLPLQQLKRRLPVDHKTAFAFQLYSLIRAGGNHTEEKERFAKCLDAIGSTKLAPIIISELSETDAPKFSQLLRVDFGVSKKNDVRLPDVPEAPRFRCYRAGGLILIRNLQETPLFVRGHNLDPNRLLQIRPSDEIITDSWRLSYQDLVFFLQCTKQNQSPDLYLLDEDGELTLSRSKAKNALAKLNFGHRVLLTPLQAGELTDRNREELHQDHDYQYDYFDLIHIGEREPLSLESLLRLTQQSGQRFVLPQGRRKVRVSNDPSALTGDSILVTPGLSDRFILEFDFDPASGLGEFQVIESNHPILANGHPSESAPLPDGSIIRLSNRQALRCRFSDNILDEERNIVRHLKVENLNHQFWKGGKAIDSVSFSLKRGQMMCIIGPSGSGKSTLLEILAGQRRPKGGHVRLNELSLYDRPTRLSPLISFMPQEEALTEQLSAREHLSHAAAIRRPHLPKPAIQKRVNYLLDELGLDRIGERRVGSAGSKSLSGGERSRLNAGLDLIGGGEIFLFDEPISGLSSKDAEHVVEALHGFSQDKIVVASLHRPSEKVMEAFDLVLLLDRGGKMAYFGPPQKMVSYFQKAAEELNLDHSQNAPQNGADFVFDVLETPNPGITKRGKNERRFQPDFWQERFENQRVMRHLARVDTQGPESELAVAEDKLPAPEPPAHARRQKWMIFKTHLARAAKSKFRNRTTFTSYLLEAPILAGLIGITLRASAEGSYRFHSSLHLGSYLFLAVTVAMFFGLTNSATDVLRDRPILRRERNCQPHPILYLGAKFLILAAMVSIQSAIFILVAHQILELHHVFWNHLSWMILTGCCGTALALLISVIARSESAALGAIPLILVPQILLAGALIPFKEMNRGLFNHADKGRDQGNEPVPSTIMPLRYAFEGSMITQATENQFEKIRQPLQEEIETLKDLEQLDADQSKELENNSEKLRILYAALAHDEPEANKILLDPIGELDQIMARLDQEIDPDEEPPTSASQYYINDRLENLVELAEATRLDERRNDRPNIFLAKKKPFLGLQISTQWYCRIYLTLLTVAFLVPASLLLNRSLTRR